MTQRIQPIVGAFYRPPAKGILASLPHNSPLRLRPERDNAYDATAVAVYVMSSEMPQTDAFKAKLTSECEKYGYDADGIMTEPEWHLGYVPAKVSPLVSADIGERQELIASLVFGSQPSVAYQVED